MAIVRERCQLNLCLPLSENFDRRLCFPLPLPPTSHPATTSTATANVADLERLKVLGHSNGGTVYKVRHKRTSAVYALKVVHSDSDATLCRQIFREMEILNSSTATE